MTARDQITEDLYKLAKEYLDNFEKYEVVYSVPERNYESRQTVDEEGIYVTMNKFRCDNFTEAHLKNYTDDRGGMILALDGDMTGTKLPKDEGHEVLLIKAHIPFFLITDRDMIVTFYENYDEETGFRNFMDASRGNEAYEKKYAEMIGNDVLMNVKINFL